MWVFFVTILAVSADAYVAGLSLGNVGRRYFLKVLYAAQFTLLLSWLFVLLSSFVTGASGDVLKTASACILILIGLKNIKSGERPRPCDIDLLAVERPSLRRDSHGAKKGRPRLSDAGSDAVKFPSLRHFSGIKKCGLPEPEQEWSIRALTLLGISVAADAAAASVMFVSDGQIWLVPLGMFAGHFFFLWAGSMTARFLGAINVFNRFSGGFLVVLGIIRLF